MGNISDSDLILLAAKARQFIELGQQLLNAARIHDLEVPDMAEIEKAVYGKAVIWFDEQAEKRDIQVWEMSTPEMLRAWLKFKESIEHPPAKLSRRSDNF